ncbi:gluconate 2-dehydrogenase subunit 3 family protein [uncultured Methylobacterium sp.]|uniref:gluconate 2-dehydrogenase subunit 3 family protein n=1 Tax=uncultured Methylobacterium sp. TaxID=157278 RepID=UPI0025924E6B|nr:gluconate 2-dehydrogenase subunit 3 family protein [uncultured Methylobacterium sp.]
MRTVDPRERYSRRFLLKGMAAAVPAAAIATSTDLSVSEAWAEGGALAPTTMKTLVKVARDIYPHDFLGDLYYVNAIKPWNEKAGADPAVKTMLEQGVQRLDADAQKRHGVQYASVGWEAQRVKLLQGVEQTDFFKKIRSDLVVSLYNQRELWKKFGYEGPSADKGGYINRGFADIDWLPKV